MKAETFRKPGHSRVGLLTVLWCHYEKGAQEEEEWNNRRLCFVAA